MIKVLADVGGRTYSLSRYMVIGGDVRVTRVLGTWVVAQTGGPGWRVVDDFGKTCFLDSEDWVRTGARRDATLRRTAQIALQMQAEGEERARLARDLRVRCI